MDKGVWIDNGDAGRLYCCRGGGKRSVVRFDLDDEMDEA